MNDPFDHWFRRFGISGRDDPFARILAQMQEQMRHLDRGSIRRRHGDEGGAYDAQVRTWSYGYRMTTDPDGETRVETWGDVPDDRAIPQPAEASAADHAADLRDKDIAPRGPLRPTIEDPTGSRRPHTTSMLDPETGTVVVTADIPGLRAEDIHVEAAGDRIQIHAARGERRYNTEIHLEATIEDDDVTTSYHHGVLEIRAPVKTA